MFRDKPIPIGTYAKVGRAEYKRREEIRYDWLINNA